MCILTPDATGSKHIVICQWLSCIISAHTSRHMEGSKSIKRTEIKQNKAWQEVNSWCEHVQFWMFGSMLWYLWHKHASISEGWWYGILSQAHTAVIFNSPSTALELLSYGSSVSLSPPNSDPTLLRCPLNVANLITRLFHAPQNHEWQNGSIWPGR